jgi:hypothetical protein
VADEYGLTAVTGVDEISITACYNLVNRRIAENPRRRVRILYVSDFDPAGNTMPLSAARKIEFFLCKHFPGVDLQLRQIVLTEQQCIEHELERIEIKESKKSADGGAKATA